MAQPLPQFKLFCASPIVAPNRRRTNHVSVLSGADQGRRQPRHAHATKLAYVDLFRQLPYSSDAGIPPRRRILLNPAAMWPACAVRHSDYMGVAAAQVERSDFYTGRSQVDAQQQFVSGHWRSPGHASKLNLMSNDYSPGIP